MNKFQKGLKFKNIEEIREYLPEEQLKIFDVLRMHIINSIPELEERISYNVPFYRKYKNICYIWPSAVPWGGIDKGVALGFSKGQQLSDPENRLHKAGKKQMAYLLIEKNQDIDFQYIESLLFEAEVLDQAGGTMT